MKMASLTTVLERIRAGQVVGLREDVQKLLRALAGSGTEESQQIIRHCSRYVYENHDMEQQVFTALLDVVDSSCKEHDQGGNDPTFHLKSMYYIILAAAKRKDLHHHLTRLLTNLEPYLKECDTRKGDAHTIAKSLFQSIWNASLSVATPLEALTLQRFALRYLIAAGTSVAKVCEQTVKVQLNYEQVQKSPEHLDKFYQFIINTLTETVKTKKKCDGEEVLAIYGLVMEYAKIVAKLDICVQFSKIIRPFVAVFEKNCDEDIILSLKFGLKLTEVGMALRVGKCNEEMMMKLVGSFAVVPGSYVPNSVILLSLLHTIALFEVQQDKDVLYSLNGHVLSRLVEALLARCKVRIAEENARKVATVLYQLLGCFVDMMKTSVDQQEVLTQALTWVSKTDSFISAHCSNKADTVWPIYNVGINSGNLGVLAFRMNKYDMAAKFLGTSVDMLDKYYTLASEEQRKVVVASLSKKMKLWSDSLRYYGQHWEAAVVAARGLLTGCLSAEDLVSIWTKCKRDAEKSGIKTLRGLTVCDVMNEARKKYQEAEGVTVNDMTALQSEIRCYKNQSYDTTEDELSCGRALIEIGCTLEMKVKGFLVVTEAMWTCPNLAAGDQDATQTVTKVISLLQKAMSGGNYNHRLRELEAVAHFWLYLCHLQQIQERASKDVQESEKPISLTTQATDLGEEEQVNDVCDVRPTATCLTLHAQEASFSPLHSALKIWDELNSQDVTLEDATSTCACLASAGYIYKLSGLVIPTVQSWAILVSLSRKHSLHTFFIKGISELLLVVPDLVPLEVVKEVEQEMESCQEASTQDSSFTYLCLTTTAAIAFYYYKIGQYVEGAEYLSRALKTDIMEKRTLRATEVQTVVHLVASLYAWLPPWVLGSLHQPLQPCVSYALLACREAIALVGSASSAGYSDVICWRHQVAWLHLTTATWLGHLCVTSVQPRLARTYLKQSLKLAQQLALPIRTAELLEVLAQVDILCDQLEDCRVKVDSLQSLLVAHSSHQQNLETLSPVFSKLSISNCSSEVKRMQHGCLKLVDKVEEDGEKMRCGMPEYKLKSPTTNPALVVVGPEERISQLINPQHPASPSLNYCEISTVVKFKPCPDGAVECVICATPTVQQLHISTAILLARVHSHGGNHRTAQICLKKAREMYSAASDKASEVSSYLASLINKKHKRKITSSSMYVLSKLNLVHLQTYHALAENLALEKKWEQALNISLQALEVVNSLDCQLLYQDMHFIAVVILQGQALQKALDQHIKTVDCNDEVCEESPKEEEEKCNSDWKTPARIRRKANESSCTKSAQRFLSIPRPPVAEEKPFSIYSEDDDFLEEATNEVLMPGQYKRSPSKPITKQVKSHVKTKTTRGSSRKKKNDVNEIASSFGELVLDDNPTRLVLKVPNSFSVSPCDHTARHSAKGAENTLRETYVSAVGKSQTKNKVVCKAKESIMPKKIDFNDKDSSCTEISKDVDDVEICYDSETRTVHKQGRTTRTARVVNKDEKRITASKHKTQKVVETKPTTRSRSSRSLRLV